ncbi:hypothetical protein M438DRAFT_95905 [Aureobasidium pullulans EXF-150]|uniref:Uncharacterized protein n=1 Tax=Aureobasidium pullulans EXF-150 TaxID=1043002 RepID=A0A074Y2I1_AURPU|nr:uncharacterized protein M438DRAFT_95905 [Aureobasidium pullulans EXF-150]KEQ81101.1 hypothetical protein M438DRAFT_95905 [Aureobasidium pullulans EXF-150]
MNTIALLHNSLPDTLIQCEKHHIPLDISCHHPVLEKSGGRGWTSNSQKNPRGRSFGWSSEFQGFPGRCFVARRKCLMSCLCIRKSWCRRSIRVD